MVSPFILIPGHSSWCPVFLSFIQNAGEIEPTMAGKLRRENSIGFVRYISYTCVYKLKQVIQMHGSKW